MEVIRDEKRLGSYSSTNILKRQGKTRLKTIKEDDSSNMSSLVERKMSNKIKKMNFELKSLIRKTKKILFQESPKQGKKEFELGEKVSLATTQSSPKKQSTEIESTDQKLLEEGQNQSLRFISARKNVYDSMEEEDDLIDEETETKRKLVQIAYFLTFSGEVGVFLSLVVGYFITVRIEKQCVSLIIFSFATDFSVFLSIIFNIYVQFRKSTNFKITLIKYLLTWFLVDLVSCFPVSASVMVKNEELARANLLFLAFRVVLLRKNESIFGNWVIAPNNLETNRLIKTFIIFSAIIFYFAIYFKFIAENELSMVDCLYFVVATSISVGYGDITPSDSKERLFTMVIQIIGLIFYTLFISMVSGYISAMTPKKIRLKEQKDILFDIYCDFNVPLPLYTTIKEYINTREDVSNTSMIDLIRSLPITVSREVLNKTFKVTLEKTPFFSELSSQLTSEMLACLNYVHYEKDETILQTGQLCEEVLIVSKGRLKFFSTLHGQRFALARMGSGQTFGESQCFLKEQAICCLVNVSSIYKGFIVKAADFDRLADEFKSEISDLVDYSLTRHECLKSKLELLKHCEKFDITVKEIEEQLDRINRFIVELEGEQDNIRGTVKNYTKKHIQYLTNNCELQKIERNRNKSLRENVNQGIKKISFRKSKRASIHKEIKQKLILINKEINSTPLAQSANDMKRRISVTDSIRKLSSNTSNKSKKSANNKFSTKNNFLSSFKRRSIDEEVRFERKFSFFHNNQDKTERNKLSQKASLNLKMIQSSPKIARKDRKITLELDLDNEHQLIKIGSASVEIKIREDSKKKARQTEELALLEELTGRLDKITRKIETVD